MKHDFTEIQSGYMFVNSGPEGSSSAILDRETGKLYYKSSEDEDEMPEDIEDEEKYIGIPHKNDLDLGKRLVFDFVLKFIPDELELIDGFFRHPGAYSNFKNYLSRICKLKEWQKYEEEAEDNALKEWCKENNIEIEDKKEKAP